MAHESSEEPRNAGKNNALRPPFEKGNPGGSGRPKGSVSVASYIKKLLAENNEEQARKLAQNLIDRASEGNGTAIKEIMSRIDGPMPTAVEHSGTIDTTGLTAEQKQERIDAIKARAIARRSELA